VLKKIKIRYQEFAELMNFGPLKGHLSSGKMKRLFVKFLYHHLVHKTPMIDYVQYEYYLCNHLGREQYMDHPKLLKYMSKMNNPEKRTIFDNKTEFDRVFADYIGRDFIDCSQATLEEFSQFISINPVFFKKPIDGLFGHGADKVITDENTNLKKLFNELKTEHSICETFLTQHSEIAKFNSSSVNTIRVVTVHDGKNVNIKAAIARFGRAGRIADNFHHEGIACKLDVDSGIIISQGRNKTGERFIFHPDSKHCFLGFQMPKWQEIINFAKKLAQVVPDVKYVGWDIVLTKDSICVIEGNFGADPDIMQTLEQSGVWAEFKKYL